MKIGIIGPTNAGKSTLFNTLVGSHRAIITDVHGTTRDILYHEVPHAKHDTVTIVDTPGLDTFEEEIPYIQKVIEESDLIFFVIDGTVDFGSKEQDIYHLILQSGKKNQTALLVNKLEKAINKDQEEVAIANYYGHGFPWTYGLSAKDSLGIKRLRAIVEEIEKIQREVPKIDPNSVPIAILGRPNAGKSTLLNHLLGEDRALVSEIPGTTLDYNTGTFTHEDKPYTLYDTAGIRKKGRTKGLERIAYTKTLTMLKYVRPYVVYLINADEGVTHRDLSLVGEIVQMALPLIICLNKVDLLDENQKKEQFRLINISMRYAQYIPVMPLSAQEGEGVSKLFETIQRMRSEKDEKISTPELNVLVKQAIIQRPPSFAKNKICRVSYLTQIESEPPTFMVFVNDTKKANFSFKKRLENTIR
jgi:GTPase